MFNTAKETTIEHYKRQEVKETILRYCQDDESWRPLNGDDGWYKTESTGEAVKLLTSTDYDRIIEDCRTLYATLDLLEPSIRTVSEKWDETKRAPEHPIGTFKNCQAFTLSVDIDSIKGPSGEDIVTSPEIKKAVEDAGQFFVDFLKEYGVSESVHCLYSGGGIYVHIHHALFKSVAGWSPEDRDYGFRSLCMAFNGLIYDVSEMFFKSHPEHKGRVKFDRLNNQKRKFKCVFSIHKRLPYAVIPLNPEHIEIEFKKASLPLSAQVLAEGHGWYREFNIDEKENLKKILGSYIEEAKDELKERREITGSLEIIRYDEAIPVEKFPPCIRNIVEKATPGKGPHRALAVMAAYLYQAGWSEEDAYKFWEPIAERSGVESRIFDVWYGQMNCPSCTTIQKASSGYPNVGLGGLGYCEPDEQCRGHRWPGEYGERNCIQLCGDLMKNIQNVIDSIQKFNNPPRIFQRGGGLCRIISIDGNRYKIDDMTDYALRNEMSLASKFEKFDGHGKECHPPLDLAKSVLALGKWEMPFLNGLINAPVMRADGTLLLEPGYDAATGLCYLPEASLEVPSIPDSPTEEDAENAARTILDEILHDFPFVDDASKANAMAAFIAPIIRPMIEGCVPLCLVDKPAAGTGASKLLELISLVSTGRAMAATSPAECEEEWRKLITGLLRDGSPLICLDNIASDLKADALARALSSTIWKDRVLGKSNAVEYPQRANWYATGNNLSLSGDIPRRSYLIQMDAKIAQPWTRKAESFRHPNIVQWVMEHRGDLLAALLTMARAWVVAGSPVGTNHTIGGFDEWVEIVGGILAYAGIGGFLDNLDKLYEEVDVGNDVWAEFLAALYEQYKGKWLTSNELLVDLENPHSSLSRHLPLELARELGQYGGGSGTKLSLILRKKMNVLYKNGLKLSQGTDKHAKVMLWSVIKATDQVLC